MKKHAKLSPSASHRWIACPGSVALSAQVPKPESSSYALEGTIAHALAENSLKLTKPPRAFVGDTVEIDGSLHTFTEEMAEAVDVYFNEVMEAVSAAGSPVLHVEESFDLSWLEDGLFGTNDAWVYNKGQNLISVYDYKHGKGVEVEAANNSQLMIYALGALAQIKKPKDTLNVKLVIVQPRINSEEKIKTWTTTAGELFTWATFILRPAIEATKQPNAKLCAGDHCRFCPVLGVCHENIKTACLVAKTDFNNPVLPNPDKLTPKDISRVLQASDLFTAWADQVKGYAQNRMEMGLSIPGYKLVAKKSNRVWKDETKATEFLIQRLDEDEVFERKLLSPAKAEKALKGIDLSALVIKPEAGVTIAPETDRRKAVNAPALADFISEEDFLK